MFAEAAITNAGAALLEQFALGGTLTITKAAAGSNTSDQLAQSVTLKNEKAAMDIVAKVRVEGGVQIHLRFKQQAQSYRVNQVGIWAKLEGGTSDGTPVLFAIYQDAEGVNIPSTSEMKDFKFEFYAPIAVSNQDDLTVTIDPQTYLTRDDIDEIEAEIQATSDGAKKAVEAAVAGMNKSLSDAQGNLTSQLQAAESELDSMLTAAQGDLNSTLKQAGTEMDSRLSQAQEKIEAAGQALTEASTAMDEKLNTADEKIAAGQAAVEKSIEASEAKVDAKIAEVDKRLEGVATAGHKHNISDVNDLTETLAGKADAEHTHDMGDVTGLDAALAGKLGKTEAAAKVAHALTAGTKQFDGSTAVTLEAADVGAAAAGHTHTASEVTDLATELGKKANATHTHKHTDINDWDAELAKKAEKTHTHANGSDTAAGFTKLYTATGTNADGAMTQKAATDTFVKKSGDTVTGMLTLQQGTTVWLANNTDSSKAYNYMKIATLTVTANWADTPITIEFTNRHGSAFRALNIMFAGGNTTDPVLKSFTVSGGKMLSGTDRSDCYIKKNGTSTWDLYVGMSEIMEDICIQNVRIGERMKGYIKIEWKKEVFTEAPEDATKATPLEMTGIIDEAKKVTHKLTAGTKKFDGSTDITLSAADVGAAAPKAGLTFQIPTSGWTGSDGAKQVTVNSLTGINTANTAYIADLADTAGDLAREGWARITKITAGTNSVTVYATEPPEDTIPVKLAAFQLKDTTGAGVYIMRRGGIGGTKDLSKATITLNPATYVYDGTAKTPTVQSVQLRGKTLKVNEDYVAVVTSGTAAGTYSAKVFGTLEYTGVATANWTITKKPITVTASTGGTYNLNGVAGTEKTITLNYEGDGVATATVDHSEFVTVKVESKTLTLTSVAAGTATVTVNVAEGTNWAAATCKITVDVQAISLTLDGNEWAQIAEIAQKGEAKKCWNVGDGKSLTIDGQTYHAMIIGFDHDELEVQNGGYNNGTGKAAITFQLVECIKNANAQWHTSNGSSVKWGTAAIRTTVSSYKSKMSDMSRNIKSVKKYYANGGFENDTLFLPDSAEINCNHNGGLSTKPYDFYKANPAANDRQHEGEWWLRDTSTADGKASYVDTNGQVQTKGIQDKSGICFCFCI